MDSAKNPLLYQDYDSVHRVQLDENTILPISVKTFLSYYKDLTHLYRLRLDRWLASVGYCVVDDCNINPIEQLHIIPLSERTDLTYIKQYVDETLVSNGKRPIDKAAVNDKLIEDKAIEKAENNLRNIFM